MARPYWSGQITISLVSFGVKLFVATESKSEIRFHQISRATGERIKYQKVTASAQEAQQEAAQAAPETPQNAFRQAVARDEGRDQPAESPSVPAAPIVQNDGIVKGYEYEKGRYVTIEPSELANLRVPSKHAMEITQFVDEADVDPEYYEKPYFVVPDGDAQAQAFAVVRQALLDTKKIALSKIAFGGREHVVAIAPADDNGMMAYTMRYAAELRDSKDYFRDIKAVEVDEDSLDLAKQLIKKRAAAFDPAKFVDGYEVALKELVEAKIEHAPIPQDEAPAPARGKVISLMDALRKSVSSATPEEAEARTAAAPDAKKKAVTKAQKAAPGITLIKSGKDGSRTVKPAAGKSAKRKSA
jgi:DNA end-binding protein Ku